MEFRKEGSKERNQERNMVVDVVKTSIQKMEEQKSRGRRMQHHVDIA